MKGKILVVDDDIHICELVKLYLEKKRNMRSLRRMTEAKGWKNSKAAIPIWSFLI